METRIKTTDYQMVSGVETYLDERLAAIEKLIGANDDGARAEVEIGRSTAHESGDVYFAEINVILKGGNIRSTSKASSVNAAIDEVRDGIVEQLRKRKQLHRRLMRRGGAAIKRIIRFGSSE